MEEHITVKKAIRGKSSELGGITSEELKHCNLDNIIQGYANILLDGEKPEQWAESSLITLPKYGDLTPTITAE